jgi:hypothetical protein
VESFFSLNLVYHPTSAYRSGRNGSNVVMPIHGRQMALAKRLAGAVVLFTATLVLGVAATTCLGIIAGREAPRAANGVVADEMRVLNPVDIAFSDAGLWITEGAANGRVLLAGEDGTAAIMSGGGDAEWCDGMLAHYCSHDYLFGVSVDPATGDVAFSDSNRHVVYRLEIATGRLHVVAGVRDMTDVTTFAPPGSVASRSPIWFPATIAFSPSNGDLLVAEYPPSGVGRLIKISAATGMTSVVLGNGEDGPVQAGRLGNESSASSVYDFAWFPDGSILVVEGAWGRLLKIDGNSGVVTVLAGDADVWLYSPDGTPALNASFTQLWGGTVHPTTGQVFFTESNAVRRIAADGTLQTVAGSEAYGGSGDGGPPLEATFRDLWTVRFDPAHLDLMGMVDNNRGNVRVYDAGSGVLYTAAGDWRQSALPSRTLPSLGGGSSADAVLNSPTDVEYDHDTGCLYVAALLQYVVVKVSSTDALVTIVAGNGSSHEGPDVVANALATSLAGPTCVHMHRGTLLICELWSDRIRRLWANGTMDTLVKGLPAPMDVAPTQEGDLIIATLEGRLYRMSGANGSVWHIAGTGLASTWQSPMPALFAPLHGIGSIVLDPHGNVIFTERRANQVVLLNVSTGVVYKIAGTGRGALLVGDAPALTVDLRLPFGLAMEPFSADLFISEWYAEQPPRILRLPAGAGGTYAESNISVFAGRRSAADDTGADLSPLAGMCFVDSSLLVADFAGGVIRSIPLFDTQGMTGFCPAGFACPCGTPRACTQPGSFCPVNTLQAEPALRGYYTTPEGGRRSGQSACPPGHYCEGGLRQPCPAGRFGAARLQATVDACSLCPVGRFSTLSGSTSTAGCLPCPAGSYAALAGSAVCALCPAGTASASLGGNGTTACLPCPAGAFALPGSATCVSLAAAGSLSAAPPVVTHQHIVEPSLAALNPGTTAVPVNGVIAIVVALILFVAAMPLLQMLCAKVWRQAKRIPVQGALRRVDMFSLHHPVRNGESPVKQMTTLGGSMSVLAVGCIAAAACTLLVQYIESNALLQSSLLAATVPALQRYAATPARGLTAVEVPSASLAVPGLRRGLAVTVVTAGVGCDAVSWSFLEPITGNFSHHVSSDALSQQHAHAFACPDCMFSPRSRLTLSLPGSCQTLRVALSAVGATGSVTTAAFALQAPSMQWHAEAQALRAVVATVVPTLEVVRNTVKGVSTRGYTVSIASVAHELAPTTSAAARLSSLQVTLQLYAPEQYVEHTIVALMSPTQLFSSVVGLLGLVGVFGIAFRLVRGVQASLQPAIESKRASHVARSVRSLRPSLFARPAQPLSSSPAPTGPPGMSAVVQVAGRAPILPPLTSSVQNVELPSSGGGTAASAAALGLTFNPLSAGAMSEPRARFQASLTVHRVRGGRGIAAAVPPAGVETRGALAGPPPSDRAEDAWDEPDDEGGRAGGEKGRGRVDPLPAGGRPCGHGHAEGAHDAQT